MEKKGTFGCFERELLVFPLSESGQGKWACSVGKYCCLGALMESQGSQLANTWPLPGVRWVEKKSGSFGNFERESLVFALSENS